MSRPTEILLAHGSGGRLTHDLVEHVFLPAFGNKALSPLEDAARLAVGSSRIAFTTDSFVVSPTEFPGGDLGTLAVCGTVNDLAVMGARPLALSAGFILEEGLPFALLERIVGSMKATCARAGVEIVTGDTKVVERGSCDSIFVNTAGIGLLAPPLPLGVDTVRPGDRVLVSGPVGDHGLAILAARSELAFETTISSDCAPVASLVQAMLVASGGVRWMRDPTRGGIATTLNELVRGRPFGLVIDGPRVPVRPAVQALADILGLDPLYAACEGRVLAVVAEEETDRVLSAMRSHPQGGEAAVIGRIVEDPGGRVLMTTGIGGTRILDMLAGEQMPRIC